ncbi:2-amino-4-hydroxy-6-hydroxymethyldihydropteridinediphosphokinase [Monaibacterium marinum]|uniref:2-amino-4-hydroxy-6-hydroxymethyldihydropteridine pyrophosphokinase n=2 Tax=Pontivivens marinum TaxID=1690039 RepID=A0A2C9CV34_9RHOB|nr:2-amino-4-hydroxy-6-hydroxymethyldihydropteridinediphosphokinase [Monaibacterium marinum]
MQYLHTMKKGLTCKEVLEGDRDVMHLIALGANLPGPFGAPAQTLSHAVAQMGAAGLRVAELSPIYATPAWPVGSGPDFANAAARVEAALDPQQVLEILHRIEADLGRVRGRRWAARACDLDLLGSGAKTLPDRQTVQRWMDMPINETPPAAPDELILPHPRLHERAFVLVPLADVAPDWVHPITGRTVRQMCDALSDEARAEICRI